MPDSQTALSDGVYGAPLPELAAVAAHAVQLSPLRPGSISIESVEGESLASIVVAAPPGAIERRFVIAHALRALRPGGRLTALAPKDKGGARLRAELEAFGCDVAERYKARQRICEVARPASPAGLDEAIAEGAPRLLGPLGLWSQPGVFSFDRIDPGSALLIDHLPTLQGHGADLGAGIGVLSRAALASSRIEALALVEIDRRAIEAARRNVPDERASFHWADARSVDLSGLDFVIINPPFHADGSESRTLGQDFIHAAARVLRKGGFLHLVANRHLPYEGVLRESFAKVETIAEGGGYKLVTARR